MRDVLVESCLLCELEAPLAASPRPSGAPATNSSRADHDEGMAEGLGIVEALRELDRTGAPDQGSFGVLGVTQSRETLLYAIASSCPGGSCSSRATASWPACAASATRPGHQRMLESQRSASPSLRRSPSRR